MFKLYIKFPQGLRLTFDKLKERLDDNESSVISTAVNVICELANKNPRNYLAMAPKFFRLLTSSSNNWMLIKVVKLLGSLVSEEPRLGKMRVNIWVKFRIRTMVKIRVRSVLRLRFLADALLEQL
jgi:AP-3 complex subunit delta-1